MAAYLLLFTSQPRPMKLFYLLLAIILTATACKKHEKLTPAAPAPPTKDFREKYTGTFNFTKSHVRSVYSRGVPAKAGDTTIGTLQISYQIGDSMFNNSKLAAGGDYFRQPALTFVYGNGTKELLGIDSLGQLYRNTMPGAPNSGGFVTADSIFHTSYDYGHNRSDEYTLYGSRIK